MFFAMLLDRLKIQVSRLGPRELIAFMVSLQTELSNEFKKK